MSVIIVSKKLLGLLGFEFGFQSVFILYKSSFEHKPQTFSRVFLRL